MNKICSKCGENKALTEFHKRTDTKDGLQPKCKVCRKSEPRPSLGERRKYLRQKMYGLSDADFQLLLGMQDERCAICRGGLELTKNGLHIDHNHSTGEVRGLLCGPCNAGLGHFKDDPILCQRAAEYLRSR